MDNARYSDEYRELEDIARLKADGIWHSTTGR